MGARSGGRAGVGAGLDAGLVTKKAPGRGDRSNPALQPTASGDPRLLAPIQGISLTRFRIDHVTTQASPSFLTPATDRRPWRACGMVPGLNEHGCPGQNRGAITTTGMDNERPTKGKGREWGEDRKAARVGEGVEREAKAREEEKATTTEGAPAPLAGGPTASKTTKPGPLPSPTRTITHSLPRSELLRQPGCCAKPSVPPSRPPNVSPPDRPLQPRVCSPFLAPHSTAPATGCSRPTVQPPFRPQPRGFKPRRQSTPTPPQRDFRPWSRFTRHHPVLPMCKKPPPVA